MNNIVLRSKYHRRIDILGTRFAFLCTMTEAFTQLGALKRKVTGPRLVLWGVIPLCVALMTALMVPSDNFILRVLLLIYSFGMVQLNWITFHVFTYVISRFILLSGWADQRISAIPGILALSLGGLVGNALLFPTREWRAELYCMAIRPLNLPCFAVQPIDHTWAWLDDFARLTFLSLLFWVGSNYIVASLFNVRRFGLRVSHFQEYASSASEASEQEFDARSSALLSRLPPELGNNVLLLVANQHYLDVHTDKGNALVLYRLSDAIKEMGDRGMQVHRSYWVAFDAIASTKKKGSSLTLILKAGQSIPVSRGYRQLFKSRECTDLALSRGWPTGERVASRNG